MPTAENKGKNAHSREQGREAYKAPLLSAEVLWLSGQVTSDNLPVEPWSLLVSQVRHTQVEELLQGRYRTGYLLDGDLKIGPLK